MGGEEGGGFRMGNTCIPVVEKKFFFLNLLLKKVGMQVSPHSSNLCFSRVDCTVIYDDSSLSEGCLFTLLTVSFIVQKLLSLIRSHLFIFDFISIIMGDGA